MQVIAKRERDARHSNKWIDSGMLKLAHPPFFPITPWNQGWVRPRGSMGVGKKKEEKKRGENPNGEVAAILYFHESYLQFIRLETFRKKFRRRLSSNFLHRNRAPFDFIHLFPRNVIVTYLQFPSLTPTFTSSTPLEKVDRNVSTIFKL